MERKMFCFFALFCAASAYFLSEEECLNYTIYPVQYELTLYPNILDGDRTYYDCNMIITIIANAPNVNVIEIDAKDLDINGESIEVFSNNNVNLINSVRPYEFDRHLGKLHIFLKKPLEVYNIRKCQYYVRMSFRKILKPEDRGVFLVKYIEGGHEKYMISTRLSHSKAKYFFPCFENNQFEAVFKFKVYLQTGSEEQHHTCLLIAEEMKTNRFRETSLNNVEYMPSPQVGVDQVGFHISDFLSKSATSRYSNDTLKVWAPKSTLSYYNYILEFGKCIIDAIHQYSTLNRRLVTGPINLIAVPTNLNSYEIGSWNLLSIGDHYLAHSPKHTSIERKEAMSFMLSQQLCRVWLGNAGEPQRTRWAQEWFKEGVATYLAYYFMSQSQQSHFNMNTYAMQMRHKAMTLDGDLNTLTLESFNRTLATGMTRHHDLVTLKTASLLRMIENWIGSEKFHLAMVKYINSRRGKFISVEDFSMFLDVETKECEVFTGHTAAGVLNSWFRQPGYPLVKVSVYRRGGNEDAVYLEQRQFTFKNASSDLLYVIPVTYTQQYPEDCYSCLLSAITVDAAQYTFTENLRGGWIILNRNASGYYRVNYDIETWKTIIKSLKGSERNIIDPLNRAQIMNDAFALYVSGNINLELAREIVSCLESEENYIVWDAAINGFRLLRIDGAVHMTKQIYNDWKALMRDQISIIYRKLFNTMKRDDGTRLFRSTITTFACSIGHLPCLNDLHMTKKLILRRATHDPDLRKIAYYTLLKENKGYDVIKDTTRFEREDLMAAEKMLDEEMRFVSTLPNKPQPMLLAEPTTRRAPKVTQIPPVTHGYKSSPASRIEFSIKYILSLLALLSFR